MNYGPLNQGVGGFLGLLGLKNNGSNVQTITDTLQPCINYLPFMLNQHRVLSTQTSSTVTTTATYMTPEAVPSNKLWIVVAAACHWNIVAGDVVDGHLLVASVNYATEQWMVGERFTTTIGTSLQLGVSHFRFNLFQPFFMYPGWSFGFRCSRYQVAAPPVPAPTILARYIEVDY